MIKLLAAAAAGYVLGTKAGRQRYEAILRAARTFAHSQTVQSTAGVVRAKAEQALHGPGGSPGGGPH
ncbi:MAG: hypothetical protein EPN43_02220 [Jatrophihabitans sp.]|nr:MAG: hypothetical protein EPN43_02220 [Jatrophihabitans sp.]